MDPQVTWDRLVTAVESDQWDEAADVAEDLLHWLRRGGFAPQILPGRVLPEAWNRAMVFAGCHAALHGTVDAGTD